MVMQGAEEPLSATTTALYAILVVLLVLGAGLMSGLTLGLLSLDVMDLEVLRVSGTSRQQSAASRLIPLVAKPHWLLCTLLLCNAACMEALPLFLDRLLNPVVAILLSVTAILLFGEIIPQAVCSRYGVAIGSTLAPLVRVLMVLCSPITWPLGKLLDCILGHENVTMKRQQLKAMVQLHGEGAGFGGKLTQQEVSVISGAMDLRYKTAISAMTPLPKVFMVSDQALLDEGLVKAMLHSGHSRVPVYRGNEVGDFAGLILVKEVLQFWRCAETPRVSQLCLRPLPRLPADTPMFDMLRFFQTGNSHMALLVAPEGSDLEEFKRTKGFMMTHDEDDSSSSSSSSSSSNDSCSSSEGEGAGRSTAGSVSSFKWRLRRRKGKRSSTDCRNSVDSGSKCASIAGSDLLCRQSQPLPCSCSCHAAQGSFVMDTAGSIDAASLPAACSLSPQHTAASRVGSYALSSLALPAGAAGMGSVGSASVAAGGTACSSSLPSPGSSYSPSKQQQVPAGTSTACVGSYGSAGSSGSGLQHPLSRCHPCGSNSLGEHSISFGGHSPTHGSPTAAAAAAAAASCGSQSQLVEVVHRSPFELSHRGLKEAYICCRCLCQLPQLPQQCMQQQPSGDAVWSNDVGPASHPVSLQQQQPHHHHHHHQQHEEEREHTSSEISFQQQQQQPSSADGVSHVALTVSGLHDAQSQQGGQQHSGNLSRLARTSSGGGSSSSHIGALVASSAEHIPPAAAAAAGSDEQQDQLGPLIGDSSPHGHFGYSSNAAIAAAMPRQVPVGIITLEDVIEELMQAEIVDETDAYMDNDKTKRVDLHQLMESLPPSMLTTLRAEMLQAAQNFIKHATWTPGTALNPNNVRQMTAIRAVAAATAGNFAPVPPGGSAAAGATAGSSLRGTASPHTTYASLSPASAPGLEAGLNVSALLQPSIIAVAAPSPASGGTVASNGGNGQQQQHWSALACDRPLSTTMPGEAAGRVSSSTFSADGSSPAAAAAQAIARLRAASSPAAAAVAAAAATGAAAAPAAVTEPVPIGGSAAGSSRVSAPGVLSKSPAASGGKPLTKAFKSAPSPLLATQASLPSGGAVLAPDLQHKSQQQLQE